VESHARDVQRLLAPRLVNVSLVEYIRAMKKLLMSASVLALAALSTVAVRGQGANGPVAAAAAAIGAGNLRSIQYSGWGSDYIFGQAYDGGSSWPRFGLPGITIAIDYTTNSLRDDRRRTQAENPPLGGGFQPLAGELRQIWALSGGHAWDVVGQTAAPAAAERDMRTAVEGRTTQIWLTPHGFIKAALAGNASVRTETVRGAKKSVITVTTPTASRFEGVIDEQNLVERVETWIANPVLGDMKIEAVYAGYKDFNGVKFPTRIVQRSGGYPILDLTVTEVTPNAPLALDVPASIRQPAASPAALAAEKVSDGLWIVQGNAKSVVVEFRDYLAVIDAPESEGRSVAVIDAIRKALPGKPIRYVVNTHQHFDHAGGLRTYAAEGAAIITQAANVPYYQQVWSNPRTIAPDRLAKSGKTPVFEGVVGSRTLRDDTREMVLYHYAGNMHNAGMLMVFLPKERTLVEADSWTPPANPNDPPAGIVNLVHFVDAVDRLRLDVDQVVPIHGRLTTMDEARSVADTFKRSQLFR
jgi:glyoxylase-like metal-dependent hydrolase (beta-lactamase superfamily II)